MFKNLKKPEGKKGMNRLDGKEILFQGKDLNDFVTSRAKTFFRLFGVNDVEEYCSDTLRNSINALKVVNDPAERGVALIKKFNASVRDEQQKHFLLRIVEHHRKVVSKGTKAGVATYKFN